MTKFIIITSEKDDSTLLLGISTEMLTKITKFFPPNYSSLELCGEIVGEGWGLDYDGSYFFIETGCSFRDFRFRHFQKSDYWGMVILLKQLNQMFSQEYDCNSGERVLLQIL